MCQVMAAASSRWWVLPCWPGPHHADRGSAPLAGMLIHKVLAVPFPGCLFMFAKIGGILLPPTVALHAAVAVMLEWRGAANIIHAGEAPMKSATHTRTAMHCSRGTTLGMGLALVLGWSVLDVAYAQVAPPKAASVASKPISGDVLEGAWARPDGGYLILIKKAAADGRLEASYFNPNPLPFAKAQFVRDGGTLRLSFVLEAGGYGGSTYELAYDADKDQLRGVYYQAVMKQKFDVQFTRK